MTVLNFKKSGEMIVAFRLRYGCMPLVMLTFLALLNYTAAAQQAPQKAAWSVTTNKHNAELEKADISALKNIETTVSASDTVLDIETKTAIKIAPIVLLKPNLAAILSLRQSLDLQFKQLQQLTETEDSFNPRFGELYSAYARTLMKMGRLPEARKMFVNALHNVKVNNGVNSMQQRPVLRELFKMEFFTENVNDAEKHLKRLLWIEKENSDDSYSFDMIMTLGNYYLSQYLVSKKPTETSLIGLNESIHYFGYALRRYRTPLLKVLMRRSSYQRQYIIMF